MLSNIYTDQVISFTTSKCYRLESSDRNYIGIYVDKGVEIVTLDCSATLKALLRRQLIETPKNCPLLKRQITEHCCPWQFDFESAVNMLMPNEAYKIIPGARIPSILHFKFSPTFENHTYIAILTTIGALAVYESQIENWTQVTDVSEEWLTNCGKIEARPETWLEWQQQLNQVKPAALCWQRFEKQLLLIAVFENGDIGMFDKTSDFKLLRKFTTLNEPPTDIHSFQFGNAIFLVLAYSTGKILGYVFHPEKREVLKTIDLWDKADSVEANRICSITLGPVVYVAASKIDQIVVFCVKPDGSFTTEFKQFDTIISAISVGGKEIYVTFSNQDAIKISLHLKEVTKIYEGSTNCPGGISTINGWVFIIAGLQNANKSFVTFLKKPEIRAKIELVNVLNNGNALLSYLDLLWLHKHTIVENDYNEQLYEANSLPKLEYWARKLSLSVLPTSDEKNRQNTLAKLEEIVKKLTSGNKQKYLSGDDFCPICDEAVDNNNSSLVTCKAGHSVPRCCISQKPCWATCSASCYLCQAEISLKHVKNFESVSCPLCDGYFIKMFETAF